MTNRIYEFSCETCNSPFTAQRRDKRFCSNSCQSKARYRQGREKNRREDVPCEYCGELFTAKRIDARYCSVKCGKRAYYQSVKETRRERSRAWTENNPEKRAAILARFKENHPDHQKERYARLKNDPVRYRAQQEHAHQYYLEHREEYIRRAKERQKAQPVHHYQYRHGRDWDELFAELWQVQGGRCYLCNDPLDRDKFRGVHLDHDHACCPLGYSCEKCRRGLSCPDCNILIGRAKDDPDRLRIIADNLEKANAGVQERMAKK